jgi:hypothetical protein
MVVAASFFFVVNPTQSPVVATLFTKLTLFAKIRYPSAEKGVMQRTPNFGPTATWGFVEGLTFFCPEKFNRVENLGGKASKTRKNVPPLKNLPRSSALPKRWLCSHHFYAFYVFAIMTPLENLLRSSALLHNCAWSVHGCHQRYAGCFLHIARITVVVRCLYQGDLS